jgi:threonine dehydrogenase-like Zn-dependent dehydrogenase
MSRLAPTLAEQPIDLSWCITHRFPLQEAKAAYDLFAYGKDDCVKAVIIF